MTAVLSETLLVRFRVAREIRLESYGPRYASIILWHNTVCVYAMQACVYIALWCAITHDTETQVPYDCILHTKRRLYANIEITKRYYRIYFFTILRPSYKVK